MWKYYLTIVILIAMGILEFKKYKDVMAATVIYPVMWVLSIAGMIYRRDMFYEVEWYVLAIIVAGYFLFCIGFEIVNHTRICTVRNSNTCFEKTVNGINHFDLAQHRLGTTAVTVVSVLVALLYLVYIRSYIDLSDLIGSMYAIREDIANEKLVFPFALQALRYFIRCSMWYVSLLLFCIPKSKGYKDTNGYNAKADLSLKLLIIVFAGLVMVFIDLSRNDILFTLLPVLFAFLLGRQLSNRKILLIIGICFLSFIVFFVWFAAFRGNFLDTMSNSSKELERSFFHYLSSSIPALNRGINDNSLRWFTLNGGNGKYTFSFLTAIFDNIFITDITPYVVQEFVTVGPADHITNVYTVYQWPAYDFGIIYAILLQLIYGVIYGLLYSKAKEGQFSALFSYSVMGYPLIMMFFEDQLFSIGQTWVIMLVFMYGIFFVCNSAKMKARGT